MLSMLRIFISQPGKSYQGKKMTGWQTFFMLLVLLALFLIPFLVNSQQSYQTIRPALEDIREKIPNFEIKNGKMILEEDSKSFVYEVDQALFFFDPNGEMNQQVVKDNLSNDKYILAGGFLQDELYLANIINDMSLPYQSLEGLNQDIFKPGFWKQFIALYLTTALVLAFFSLLLGSLLSALFVKVIAFISTLSYRFVDIWRIVLAASLFPMLLYVIARLLNLNNLFVLSLIRVLPIFISFYSLSKDPEKNTPL